MFQRRRSPPATRTVPVARAGSSSRPISTCSASSAETALLVAYGAVRQWDLD
jgi:hypothetical protein